MTIGPNVVLFDSCDDYTYRYSFGIPAGAEDWSAEVSVIGPDGNEATSDFLWGVPKSGRSELSLCGERPGRYTWTATVSWYDFDYNESTFTVRGNAFRLSLPASRTTLTGRNGNPHRFVAKVRDQRPRGFFPSELAWVTLQRKVGGRWQNLGRELTNSNGVARWSVRNLPRRQVYRAVTPQQEYPHIRRSTSRLVALR